MIPQQHCVLEPPAEPNSSGREPGASRAATELPEPGSVRPLLAALFMLACYSFPRWLDEVVQS
jgi:hypothetical protein